VAGIDATYSVSNNRPILVGAFILSLASFKSRHRVDRTQRIPVTNMLIILMQKIMFDPNNNGRGK